MNRLTLIALSAIIALVGFSCGTSQNSASLVAPTLGVGSEGADGARGADFAKLTESYGTWQDVKIPLSVSLSQPVKAGISGTVTMTRDRDIYISMRFLGMEVLSIYVTQDSLFATYKPGKLYVAESLDGLLGGFPVTVGNVQDLLLGRAFVAGRGLLTTGMAADVTVTKASKGYVITPASVRGVGYTFSVNASDQVAMLTVTPSGSEAVTVTYGTDVSTKAGNVSPTATVLANVPGARINATLEWDLDNARWNSGSTKTWTAPKGYKKVHAADLLQLSL